MDTEHLLKKINSAALRFLKVQELNETYKIISEEVKNIIGGEYNSIVLKEDGVLKRVYASSPLIYQIKIDKKSLLYKSLKNQSTIIINEKRIKKFIYIDPVHTKLKDKLIILIPLIHQKESVGVVSVFFSKALTFTNNELDALKLFGSTASLGIRKAKIYNEMKEAIKEKDYYISIEDDLEKIYKSALKFLVHQTLKDTYKTIVEEGIKLVGGKYGSLILKDNNSFKAIFSTLPIAVNRRKKGTTGKAVKESKVVITYNQESLKFKIAHPEFVPLGIKTIVDIPLSYKNRSIGDLAIVLTSKKVFTAEEQYSFLLFGSLATLAIRKTQLHDEVQKALIVRDRFIAIVAHEFRTPLTSINGYIQLLLKKLTNNNDLEKKWTQHLYTESSKLTNLVKDILEINHIQSGKHQYIFKEHYLNEIINKAINDFRISYPNRNVVFKNYLSDGESVIIGDSDKLIQVIRNLLENASKYSPQNKDIYVELETKSTYLILNIIDQGFGISKKELPLISQGFYKGTNAGDEGMGLGIYLATNILKNHHGLIKINSKINKGTNVEIRLPKAHI